MGKSPTRRDGSSVRSRDVCRVSPFITAATRDDIVFEDRWYPRELLTPLPRIVGFRTAFDSVTLCSRRSSSSSSARFRFCGHSVSMMFSNAEAVLYNGRFETELIKHNPKLGEISLIDL